MVFCFYWTSLVSFYYYLYLSFLFPNCIDPETSKNPNPYDTTNFNILTVSRLDSSEGYKGIDSLIKTIPSVIKKVPNAKLTIVGKGDDKKRLEKLAISLDISDFVEFKGYVESIDSYYEHCDVFSRCGGFGQHNMQRDRK